ncbi:MAG: hypothetical protein COB79_04725 [Zetaproteobacteria bacterium]|nr:MAG: hypothetical protein COB79_04725 [Zetaproteobacteria bacterium]
MSERKTRPGIHQDFVMDKYDDTEYEILRRLSHEWYLTRSGYRIEMAASSYQFFLMKPTPTFSEMFNIEREVICIFSPYETFEPRTLSAFLEAQRQLSSLRTETVCRIVISKDPKIESKIESLLKTDPEQPITIPFTYDELTYSYDNFFIRNRFRKHFYSRNLFNFLSPLKSDLYFFGRSELVHEIVNRHRDGEHTGLFGLRKSGKTSIIYAVERTLKSSGWNYVSIDCESPSIHQLRWNELLEKVVNLYYKAIGSKTKIDTANRYSEKTAADSFEEDILKIFRSKKKQSALFMFDEIERVTPGTASSEHWRTGSDFIFFWQTLRGFYQRNPNIFTYMLVGTNPNCIESAMLVNHENPIFSSIPCSYVPNFTVHQVRQMVQKLGRYIGLSFDDIVISKLADDFGGHPFLIRQACSIIHEECKGDRPVDVDKALYESIKKKFFENSTHYLDMIVQVLKDWYPDEYEMLKYLSQNDLEMFNEFAEDNPAFTRHLIGYGLIQNSNHGYSFNIEVVKDYLKVEHKYERINLSNEEKVEEVSRRRNILEKILRKTIKNTLVTLYGKNKARDIVLAAIPSNRRGSLEPLDITELLKEGSSPLYFLDLENILNKNWENFKHIFSNLEKSKVILILSEINKFGRADAHAKVISNDDFTQLRLHFNNIEQELEGFW